MSTAAFPRMQFLFETLTDLDNNLKAMGTRLYFLRGNPVEVFENLFKVCIFLLLCFYYRGVIELGDQCLKKFIALDCLIFLFFNFDLKVSSSPDNLLPLII